MLYDPQKYERRTYLLPLTARIVAVRLQEAGGGSCRLAARGSSAGERQGSLRRLVPGARLLGRASAMPQALLPSLFHGAWVTLRAGPEFIWSQNKTKRLGLFI